MDGVYVVDQLADEGYSKSEIIDILVEGLVCVIGADEAMLDSVINALTDAADL